MISSLDCLIWNWINPAGHLCWYFKDDANLAEICFNHTQIDNHFNHERHLESRQTYKQKRTTALTEWFNFCAAWWLTWGAFFWCSSLSDNTHSGVILFGYTSLLTHQFQAKPYRCSRWLTSIIEYIDLGCTSNPMWVIIRLTAPNGIVLKLFKVLVYWNSPLKI